MHMMAVVHLQLLLSLRPVLGSQQVSGDARGAFNSYMKSGTVDGAYMYRLMPYTTDHLQQWIVVSCN